MGMGTGTGSSTRGTTSPNGNSNINPSGNTLAPECLAERIDAGPDRSGFRPQQVASRQQIAAKSPAMRGFLLPLIAAGVGCRHRAIEAAGRR